MNKVKLLSDIMKAMRNKEDLQGRITVDGKSPKTSLNFTKIFNADDIKNHHGHRGHCGMGHGHFMKHKRMHSMHEGSESVDMNQGMHQDQMTFTWKDKLSMASTTLDLFNSIQVKKLGDGQISLSLSKADLSEELITQIKEGIHKKHSMMGNHKFEEHKNFAKHLHEMDNPVFNLNIIVNEVKELQVLTLSVESDSDDGKHELNVDINFE